MTVKELRGKLAEFKDHEDVVVVRETDEKVEIFDILDISLHTGQSRRLKDGTVGINFSVDGPGRWVCIGVEEA